MFAKFAKYVKNVGKILESSEAVWKQENYFLCTKFTLCVTKLPQDVDCRLLNLFRAAPAWAFQGFRKTPYSDVFPERFPKIPGLAEFAFVVRPKPLWADGQDVGPPPWGGETMFFSSEIVKLLGQIYYQYNIWQWS